MSHQHPPLNLIPRDLMERLCALPGGQRRLVAVAGAPASGKSMLSEALHAALEQKGHRAEVVPMDGFHLDNTVLDARGLRARKGAPETFDAEGFIALMQRLRSGAEVVYPVFDRARDLSIAGAGVVPATCDFVLVEGNYLLFDEAPWSALAAIWDFSAWLDTPEETVRKRSVARWLAHGHTPEQARARAEGNDLANARRVMGARLPADMILADP